MVLKLEILINENSEIKNHISGVLNEKSNLQDQLYCFQKDFSELQKDRTKVESDLQDCLNKNTLLNELVEKFESDRKLEKIQKEMKENEIAVLKSDKDSM